MNKAQRSAMAHTFLYMGIIFQLSAFAGLDGSMGYEKYQRLNNPAEKSKYDDWTSVGILGSGKLLNAKLAGETEFRVYMSDKGAVNFSVPEAYMEWVARDQRLSVGRQRLNWNENENYWLLGTVNPNQGFYLLSEKKEGLTGVQYDRRITQDFTVSIFFSYLNIPALNPSVEIVDGEIISTSEWMKLPPRATAIEGQEVPLNFMLNKPDIMKDIVLKKSLGVRQAFSWDKGRGEFSSYFIYKPENKLRMNAEAYMDEKDLRFINVIANPIVNHHVVYGMQLRHRFGSVNGVIGLDINDPNARLGKDFKILDDEELRANNRVFESDYFTVKPNYVRESYFHASANMNRGRYMLSFNYIKLMSDNDRSSDDFYSDTVKWKQAVGTRARYYFQDNLNLMVDLKYDIDRKDNILKIEGYYGFSKYASLNIGVELIKSPEDSSYWAAYRANDNVYSSIKVNF